MKTSQHRLGLRSAFLLKTTFILVLAAAGCRSLADDATPPTLHVYSGRGEPLVAPLFARFEAQSGIRLRVHYADSAQLASTLITEGARSPADVFFSQDADSLALLDERGMLAPLPETLLAQADARFRAPQGTWVGTSGRARVLAWNTGRLRAEDLPGSVDGLLDPIWRGRIGWAPENASFQAFLAAMIALRGVDAAREWTCGVQANKPRAYPSNTPLVTGVGRGEVDVALTNHYYLYRLRAEHGGAFPVANHYFRNGQAESLVSVSGMAVLATSRRRAAAEELVAFVLSDEGQQWIVENNFEFPVRDAVPVAGDLPPPSSLRTPDLGPGSGEGLRAAIAILRECGALL